MEAGWPLGDVQLELDLCYRLGLLTQGLTGIFPLSGLVYREFKNGFVN